MKNFKILFSFLIVSLFIIGGCKDFNPFDNIKTGFLFNSPRKDGGWSKAHETGRVEMEKLDIIESSVYLENIPESFEAERAIEELISTSNCNVIFATSGGYEEAIFEVAKKYPKVKFMLCGLGEKKLENFKYYFGKYYQAKYLSGMLAGLMTKSNKIGCIAAYPYPTTKRFLNAFALGVRSVNKDAKVYVIWLNTWFDPGKEMKTAEYLIGNGCDIITQETNSPAPQQAAEAAKVYSIGNYSDMKMYSSEACLTSTIFNWDVFYKKIANDIKEGTWDSKTYNGGMETGIVGITDISNKVPKEVVNAVKEKEKEFKAGKDDVFSGPIYDNNGKLVVGKGKSLTDKEKISMDWLVNGIENLDGNDQD